MDGADGNDGDKGAKGDQGDKGDTGANGAAGTVLKGCPEGVSYFDATTFGCIACGSCGRNHDNIGCGGMNQGTCQKCYDYRRYGDFHMRRRGSRDALPLCKS